MTREEKLDAHICLMQHAMQEYLVPDGSIDANAFINRMIYLLDGPEQREAQAVQPATIPLTDAEIEALMAAQPGQIIAVPVQVPATCVWTQIGDEWDGPVWESTCGELWSFIDGGPKENRVSYCHNCGRKVELPAAPEVKP